MSGKRGAGLVAGPAGVLGPGEARRSPKVRHGGGKIGTDLGRALLRSPQAPSRLWREGEVTSPLSRLAPSLEGKAV